MEIHETISNFFRGAMTKGDRYRSWDHCYAYFHNSTPKRIRRDKDHAALQLGFYLASWGMYRNSFLLNYDYTVHVEVIDRLVVPQFARLWKEEFGAGTNDTTLLPIVLDAIKAVQDAYRPAATEAKSKQVTDTLVTKVLLGIFGCLPARDWYFNYGLRTAGFKCPHVDRNFVEAMLRFCGAKLGDLRKEQATILSIRKVYYPLMKLVDMHFNQMGWQRSVSGPNSGNAV